MKILSQTIAGAVAGLFLLAGCRKSASTLGSRNASLFKAATPEIKLQWDTATAAMATNGFVPAMVALKKLQQAGLTSEQTAAVGATATAVSDEMYAAANKGDARAKEAIVTLRQLNAR